MFTNEFEVKCGGAKQTNAMRMNELARAVRSGSVASMDELFELASSYAIFLAKKGGAKQEDAEDIAQEAMLQLLENINNVETVSAWLRKVVFTKAADAFNKEQSPYKMCPLDTPWGNSEVDSDSMLLSEVIADLRSSEFSEVYLDRYAVQQILAIMPDQQKKVLYLQGIMRYSQDEIAGMLGISRSAVAGNFRKGKANFHREFTARFDLALFGYKSAYELEAA